MTTKQPPQADRRHATWSAWGSAFSQPFRSLRFRDYRLLTAATAPVSLAFWMEQIVLGWLVLKLTDSALLLGVASAARMAPWLFLGMVAGAAADRVDRRVLLPIIAAGQAALNLSMGALVVLDQAALPIVFAYAVLSGVFAAFLFTARQAYIADILGGQELQNGIALNQVAQRTMGIPGAFFGGSLIGWLGIGEAFLVMGGAYVIAAIVQGFMQTRSERRDSQPTMWRDFVSGLQLIRDNRVITGLLILAVATEILAFSHASVLPIFARDIWHAGPEGLGLLGTARAVGALLGVMALASLGSRARLGKLLLLCGSGFGVSLVAFGWAPNLLLGLIALGFAGLASGTFDALQQTTLQTVAGEGQRGRAMGVWVLGLGMGPIGHLEVGALAQTLNAPVAISVNAGLLLVIIAIVGIAAPQLRRV